MSDIQQPRKRKLHQRLLLIFMAGWIAFFYAGCVQQNHHSLFDNGSWRVGKRLPLLHTMASDDFLISRAPLFLDKLALHSYFGYQEVVYKTPLVASAMRFSMHLRDDGVLHVILAQTPTHTHYLRLSKQASLPSTVIVMESDGVPQARAPIAGPIAQSDRPQHVQIFLSSPLATIDIDGVRYGEFPWQKRSGFIGFKGDSNLRKLEIDDIAITTDDQIIEENFTAKEPRLRPFAVAFLCLSMLALLAHYFLRLLAIKLLLPVAMALPVFYFFDLFFWSHLEISALTTPIHLYEISNAQTIQKLEDLRYGFVETLSPRKPEFTHKELKARGYPLHQLFDRPFFCRETCKDYSLTEIKDLLKTPVRNGTLRVLMVGSSQTYGEGATTIERTHFARHHAGLRKIWGNAPVELLNISLPGRQALDMLEEYNKHFSQFKSDLTYFNMAFNDAPQGYETRVAQVIQAFRQRGLILITEPTPERIFVEAKHQHLKRLATHDSVPLIDMQKHLDDQGITLDPLGWWDYVHLTDYGQSVFAGHLNQAPEILKAINKIRQDRSL